MGHHGLFDPGLRRACSAFLGTSVPLLEQLPLQILFLVLKPSASGFSADDKVSPSNNKVDQPWWFMPLAGQPGLCIETSFLKTKGGCSLVAAYYLRLCKVLYSIPTITKQIINRRINRNSSSYPTNQPAEPFLCIWPPGLKEAACPV